MKTDSHCAAMPLKQKRLQLLTKFSNVIAVLVPGQWVGKSFCYVTSD